MKKRAVLFDLFETLVTEFADGKRIGKRPSYKERLGIADDVFTKEWHARQERRMTGQFQDYLAVVKEIMAVHQLPCDDDQVEALYRERIEAKRLPFVSIRPEVVALLDALRKEGLAIGIVSNCTEEEVGSWHESAIARYVDDVVLSYAVGWAKPDERIYRLACERLAVEPEEAVFVGDGGSGELEGADHAGMTVYHAFWFNTYITSAYKKLLHPSDLLAELTRA